MSEKKIDNTFMRSMEQINNLEKVFREGGLLEKSVMDIKGDVAWLKDIREALANAYESLEEGHIGTTGHLDVPEESVEPQPVTEGVLDSDDDDGFMARSQLYFMARDAISLHGMIDDRDDLEPWVQSKIAQSAEAIDAVRRYTEYNSMKDDGEAPLAMPNDEPEMDPEMGEDFEVLPSFDKEKYQDRDGLEGPIPTRSGKVLYYDPKEGKYYDPDSDMYLTYDDWKQYDSKNEGVMESLMEDCGCESDDGDMNAIMRYMQLKAEGREDEAEQLAEALPLLAPLAIHGARFAAQRALPWVVRQLAGKGAGQAAKKIAQRGVKRGGQIIKRSLRGGKAKGRAAKSAAGTAAVHGVTGGNSGWGGDMDYLTKMNSSADEGKPAIQEKTVGGMDLPAIGRVLAGLSAKGGYKDETLNVFARVADHLENYGEPFGPRTPQELADKTMLSVDALVKVIKFGNAHLQKSGEPEVPDPKEPAGEAVKPNFVKEMRKALEAKMANKEK